MSPRIDRGDLDRALARRGLEDSEGSQRILRATVAVLGERLVDDEAKALAATLPVDLAKIVEDVEYDGDFDTDEMFERIRHRARTTLPAAREQGEIVLAALGACMEPDRRGRIARGLPERAADFFLERCGTAAAGEAPPHRPGQHAPKLSTLATGRPGSAHPLAESAPRSGQMHSVACNPAPHEDTKMSTSRGPTQTRLGETLAEGRPPGPARPITDATD